MLAEPVAVPVLATSAVTYTGERGVTLAVEREALCTAILAIRAGPRATAEAPLVAGISMIQPIPNASIRTINTEKYLQATGFIFPSLPINTTLHVSPCASARSLTFDSHPVNKLCCLP